MNAIVRAFRDARGPLMSRPKAAPTPEDEVAFRAYAANITAQFGILSSAFMLVFTIVWGSVDHIVLRPEDVESFRALRIRAVTVEAVVLALFGLSATVRRHAMHLGPLGFVALLGSIGYSLGATGNLLALSDGFIGILPMALFPAPLLVRSAWTFAVAAALLGGFFVHPGTLEIEGTWMQISFSVFAVLLTISIGELSYRVARLAFFQQRELNRANARLEDMTHSLGETVAERTEELRRLAAHLSEAQESERRRIARDLHDDLGQSLTAMRYTLARLEDRVRSEDGLDLLDDLGALLDGTFGTVRGFLSQLRPRILDDLGLAEATEWLAERTAKSSGLVCEASIDEEARTTCRELAPDVALVLFRVLQEGTTNALRHAAPTRLQLRVTSDSERFAVEVIDDGRGFDPEAGQQRLRPAGPTRAHRRVGRRVAPRLQRPRHHASGRASSGACRRVCPRASSTFSAAARR
ncbi:MAG: histidine kinase [Polyangiales bacterium]